MTVSKFSDPPPEKEDYYLARKKTVDRAAIWYTSIASFMPFPTLTRAVFHSANDPVVYFGVSAFLFCLANAIAKFRESCRVNRILVRHFTQYRPSGSGDNLRVSWNLFWTSAAFFALSCFLLLAGVMAAMYGPPNNEGASTLFISFFIGVPALLALGANAQNIEKYRHICTLPVDTNPTPEEIRRQRDYEENQRRKNEWQEFLIQNAAHIAAVNEKIRASRESQIDIIQETYFLSNKEKSHHVWLPGTSGQGKTSMMHWMAHNQDSGRGKGVTIIDPDGNLALRMLESIHLAFPSDTLYFDLNHPIPIDFFGWDQPEEKEAVAESLRTIFARIGERSNSDVGKVMTSILVPLFNTLLDARHVSFLDIYWFLVDGDRRTQILSPPSMKLHADYWARRRLNPQETDPITRLLEPIIGSSSLRAIFGCPHSRDPNPPHKLLRFTDIIREKKTLIINLGALRGETFKLVGSLFLSKIIDAAYRVGDGVDESDRIYHMLYVDEFHLLEVSRDFETIMTQMRKYHLCLTLANQKFDQMDPRVFSALMSIKNTYIFKLNHIDANFLRNAGLQTQTTEPRWFDEKKRKWVDTRPTDFREEASLRGLTTEEVIKKFDVLELTRLEPFHVIHHRAGKPIMRALSPPWDWCKRSVEDTIARLREGDTPLSQKLEERITNLSSHAQMAAEEVRSRTLRDYGCNDSSKPHTYGHGITKPSSSPPPDPGPETRPIANKSGQGKGPRNTS